GPIMRDTGNAAAGQRRPAAATARVGATRNAGRADAGPRRADVTGRAMVKRTGGPAVDRPVRRLVDAINRSPFAVRTTGSCSAHLARAGFPYVRFEATGWEF